jgi:hypothetical protein
MPPTPNVQHAHLHLVRASLSSEPTIASASRARRLDDDRQFGGFALLDAGRTSVRATAAGGGDPFSRLPLAELGDLAGAALVLDTVKSSPALGVPPRPSTSTGIAGPAS